MSKIRTLMELIKNKPQDISRAVDANISKWKIMRYIPDRIYLKMRYILCVHKRLNLADPIEFNEKLQWLKLYDRNPLYSIIVDKYEAKKYISNIIGEEYIIPTLGVWDDFESIDFDRLPNQFVLKCTHDSGGVVVCKDKQLLVIDWAKEKMNSSLRNNFFYFGREWPYKDVKHRIIAEKYLQQENEEGLIDYKVHCFNGEPKLILVCKNRFHQSQFQESFFDIKWNQLELRRPGRDNCTPMPRKPFLLNDMLSVARRLSNGIPFMRVDFYEVENHLYFGELTLYPASGFLPFEPDEYDKKLGEWIDLSLAWNNIIKD